MIRIDSVGVRAYAGDRELHLRLSEYRLLACLAHAGGPVSTEEVLRQAFGLRAHPQTNRIAVTLCRLRAQIGDPRAIVVRGGRYELLIPATVEPRL